MTTQLADRVSGELALDKPVVLGLLAEAGITVPDHVAVERRDVKTAARFLEHNGPTVVVKPTGSAGGAGIVGSIASLRQLKAALLSSGRYADRLLVERQLSGDTYRLTFLDGVLIDVVRRLPPRLIGDGTSTVAALLLAEFERRIEAGGDPRGFKPFDADLDCVFTLAAQRLSLDSVLAAGQSARVRTATNYTGPEHSFTAPGSVGNEVVAAARAAAGVVGMRLAGVDVVTPDATRPLADVGGAVLEVNAPALHHHYNVADREAATRVAVPILASLLGLSPTDWPGTANSRSDARERRVEATEETLTGTDPNRLTGR